ncbi:MAG: hypothetical protein ROW52_00375 [Anaerolineaceae bacterium]|jgi:hypothetical protein
MDADILDLKQLIVALPGCLATHRDLAFQMRKLAQRYDAKVVYLVLAENAQDMMELPPKMSTMEAITHGSWVIVVANMIDIPGWQKNLQKICRSQDLIVVASEQNVKSGQLRPIRISDYLCAPLKKQQRTPNPSSRNTRIQHKSYAARFFTWVGFAVLLVTSSFFERDDLLRLHDFILKHSSH